MRLPAKPPSVADLILKTFERHPGRMSEVLSRVEGPLVNQEYVHWDKLRYLTPPDGLTLEEWWLGIALKRGERTYLPLENTNKERFSFNLPSFLQQRLHEFDFKAGGSIQVSKTIPNPEERDSYIARSIVEEAFTSSQLEGAASTREIAKELIRKQREPKKPGDRMILNNYRTMQRILELKGMDLTVDLVFEIHRIATEGTLDDPTAAGRLRKDTESRVVADAYDLVLHEPPPASQLRHRMEAMCRFANDLKGKPFIHPVIRAMALHFWLAYDHPFVDGNGRTARALFYWSMLRQGYWLCEFISISSIILKAPAQYGAAFLHTETDSNDLTYFLVYHANILSKAIDEVSRYITQRTAELADLQSRLRGLATLNYRQRELIRHALRHPRTQYTFDSHRSSHGIALPTARTDLRDLMDRGFLQEHRIGRKCVFVAVRDLERRLKQPVRR